MSCSMMPLLVPFWVVSRAKSFPKDRPSYADYGRAFFDGHFKVIGHAHGQVQPLEKWEATGKVVTERAQTRKIGRASSGSSTTGAIVINPSSRRAFSARVAFGARTRDERGDHGGHLGRARPNLLASPDMLTSSKIGSARGQRCCLLYPGVRRA